MNQLLPKTTAGVLALLLLLPISLFASVITYEHDALDRLTQVSYGDGTVVQYSYDPAGNRSERRVLRKLSNGQIAEDLSGTADSESLFILDIPADTTVAIARLLGGAGDVAMGLRDPSGDDLPGEHCQAHGDNGREWICVIETPSAGQYSVVLEGVTGFSEATLEVRFDVNGQFLCGPHEHFTLYAGPPRDRQLEIVGCLSILVHPSVEVPEQASLVLGAVESIRFPQGVRVRSGGMLRARVETDAAPILAPFESKALLAGAGCAGYGVCGIEFTLNEGIDLAQVELSVDWGDGSSSSAMSLQQCVQLGICSVQSDRRYRLWRRYETAGSHPIQFAYRYGSQPFDTAHYAANVGLDADFLLRATAGDQEVTVEWPTVGADAYNLCRSGVSVGVFDNCYVVGGRPVDVDIGLPPQVVSGLTNHQPYFFQVEAQFGNQRLLSNEASATPGTQTVARRQLADTGILWCAGQNSSLLTCPVAGFPEQDGEHGRDVLAAAGQLDKIGFGSAAMDYTKIGNDGTELAEPASLGTAPGDWGCTRDNLTGLWWEVKQTEQGHLRHVDNTYTWFETESPDGQPGTADGGVCSVGSCDTADFVNTVNAQGLCGRNDWRLPTIEELHSIGYLGQASPTIDLSAFPNTPASRFWSGSVDASSALNAWAKDFAIGGDRRDRKNEAWAVRLVRGGT